MISTHLVLSGHDPRLVCGARAAVVAEGDATVAATQSYWLSVLYTCLHTSLVVHAGSQPVLVLDADVFTAAAVEEMPAAGVGEEKATHSY